MPAETAADSAGVFAVLESGFEMLLVSPIERLIFFDLVFWDNATGDAIQLPIVVVWLVLGALFFTFRFQFVNFRGFRHGIDCRARSHISRRCRRRSPPRSDSAISPASPLRSESEGRARSSG